MYPASLSIVLTCLPFTPLGPHHPWCASGNALTYHCAFVSTWWNTVLCQLVLATVPTNTCKSLVINFGKISRSHCQPIMSSYVLTNKDETDRPAMAETTGIRQRSKMEHITPVSTAHHWCSSYSRQPQSSFALFCSPPQPSLTSLYTLSTTPQQPNYIFYRNWRGLVL